jgi:hypothetical protein
MVTRKHKHTVWDRTMFRVVVVHGVIDCLPMHSGLNTIFLFFIAFFLFLAAVRLRRTRINDGLVCRNYYEGTVMAGILKLRLFLLFSLCKKRNDTVQIFQSVFRVKHAIRHSKFNCIFLLIFYMKGIASFSAFSHVFREESY